QRGAGWIGLRLRVAVVVPRERLLNRRDRSPEVVVLLAVPGSDASVGAGQVAQGEQSGTVTEPGEALTVPLFRSHFARFDESSEHAFKEGNGVARPEVRGLGLVGSAGHAGVPNRTTQGFHLVVGPGVFAAGQLGVR